MRVLHVVESLASGTLAVVQALAVRLAAEGRTVAVAYGVRPETPARVEEGFGGRVELIPMPWSERSVRAQLAAVRALRGIVRSWRPDVVHLHSSFAGAVGVLGVPRGVPTVYTPHGYSVTMTSAGRLSSGAFRLAERTIARRVSMVGATSNSEAEVARSVIRAPRVTAVPNGIPELDSELPPRGDEPESQVVAIGRIGPARRPEESARILGSVADVARVAWVGDGPGGEEERRVFEEAGVEVTGWLGREEVLARLRQARVCLHWSAWDGLPMVVLEALANDVVVVASDIPPNREILGEAQVASSAASASALVRRVLCDPDARAALLQEQRARRGYFSADRMASDWMRLYATLTT